MAAIVVTTAIMSDLHLIFMVYGMVVFLAALVEATSAASVRRMVPRIETCFIDV